VTSNIVAGVNTTQSIAVSPDDDAIWVAKGDHPVSHSECYRGFRISALLKGDRDRYDCDDLPGAKQLDANEELALAEYAQAWTEYFDNRNEDLALFHLRRAQELIPGEAVFSRMAGFLLLKGRKYAQALPFLIQNSRYDYKDDLMRCESHLWLGRCLDLLGRRDEAKEQYKRARDLGGSPLSDVAYRHMKKPFRSWELLDMSPDFVVGTALAKYRAK